MNIIFSHGDALKKFNHRVEALVEADTPKICSFPQIQSERAAPGTKNRNMLPMGNIKREIQ